MAGGFEEAGAGGYLAAHDVADALADLRARLAVQDAADARAGLEARRIVLPMRDLPFAFDRAEAVLVALPAFERTLVEGAPAPAREAARATLLAHVDALSAAFAAKPARR